MGIDWNTIILAIIGLVGTIISAVVTVYLAQISNHTKKSMASAADTAVSVEKVHVAVNSERLAMVAEISALRNALIKLSIEHATLVARTTAS